MSDAVERFWAKVDKTAECWQWTGALVRGYGRFKVRSYTTVPAHRYAYETEVGPIPDGLALDHLCRNPGCVNPAHLEPVTRGENVRRGLKGRMVTHCPQGHPYDEANTYVSPEGLRHCRHCRRDRSREAYRNRRAEETRV